MKVMICTEHHERHSEMMIEVFGDDDIDCIRYDVDPTAATLVYRRRSGRAFTRCQRMQLRAMSIADRSFTFYID